MEEVRAFYNEDSEYEWSRRDRHPVEFAITERTLDHWLESLRSSQKHPLRICDVGGGPGRYSLFLAQRGHQVTLLDLADAHVERARLEAHKAGITLEGAMQGNALDLSRFADASFDAVLLLGPLYHLQSAEERRQAVLEARRILKPRGLLFSGFIGRFASARTLFARNPERLARDVAHAEHELEILRQGFSDDSKLSSPGFPNAYLAHPDEVRPFLEQCGLRTLDYLGCEAFAIELENRFLSLPEEERRPWFDLLYGVCREPSLLGAAAHLLHVGIKEHLA